MDRSMNGGFRTGETAGPYADCRSFCAENRAESASFSPIFVEFCSLFRLLRGRRAPDWVSDMVRSPFRLLVVAALVAVGSVCTSVAGTLVSPDPAAAAATTTRFVALANPTRLMDTRTNLGNSPAGKPRAGSTTVTSVAGRVGIPANATAVVMNVTVDGVDGAGYVTVFPAGSAPPNASNVNTERSGQTIPNLVTVPVGAAGQVGFFVSMSTHVIADVFGYYVPATSSRAGRYEPRAPQRMADTRGTSIVGPGGVRRIALPGVPADAIAAVLNITITGALGGGYLTAYAAGAANPGTSNLNVTGAGQTIANQVIVPISAAGIDVFLSGGGHVIVDLFGWYTGPTAADSSAGLFVPLDGGPTRFLDTRGPANVNPLGAGVKLLPGWTVEALMIGRSGIPSGASAVVMNTTLVDASRAGYVTVYPAGSARPDTSSVNVDRRGQTIANHTISPITARGVASFAFGGAHLIQDVSGWFTGAPLTAVQQPPSNTMPTVTYPMTIKIPSIGITAPVGQGIAIEQLNPGPGHWPGTALPGRIGNMSVFGHRVSHTAPFRYLNEVGPGDDVLIQSNGYTYVYRYIETIITGPDDVETFAAWTPNPTITLVACHPPTSVAFRIVVRAELVDIY
jgi:LPXTG-site transpeptidase (sortase) family protein